MDLKKNIIIIKGVDKTYQLKAIKFEGNRYVVLFNNTDKFYSYSRNDVLWLINPVSLNIEYCKIRVNGKKETGIKEINLFSSTRGIYYAIIYKSGFVKHYRENEIEIRRSCLNKNSLRVFEYFRQCASINKLGTDGGVDSSEGILSSIFAKIDFIDVASAAAVYLDPNLGIRKREVKNLLFPFGCNASQQRAVITALTNQISVIQGPPGTGKTQTILNIIANLLYENKTVLVVSNNNSATENVLEKLEQSGLGFLVAPLGKKENKEAFIANLPALNPELPTWRKTQREESQASKEVKESLRKVESIFGMQERLAICRQELAEVEIELVHYENEQVDKFVHKEVKTSSGKLLKLLTLIRDYADKYQEDDNGFVKRMKLLFDKLNIELRLRFKLEIKDKLNLESIPKIISLLNWLFYIRKIQELKSEIEKIEGELEKLNGKELMEQLIDGSMVIFKNSIAKKFQREREPILSVKDLTDNAEKMLAGYPVVLSTTFSAKTCFNEDTLFDYVIMDEASQVSVETGFLALTCAKNAVIVGDTMQLPNVVTEEDQIKLDEIRKIENINDSYDSSSHSFLSSVLEVIPDVLETLLREHYRCHPDIINFCNQKFYGGSLLIMTERKDDENHLLALTTVEGHHSRGHYNQREIDAVKIELLPLLDNFEETGIIAPYNNQVDQFKVQIPKIEAATIHKYQGREKDTIIMSVTDDVITDFTDNANLLNVAVSRAKNKFCLVVTGNPQELKGNIYDLLGYIKYQQGTIIESKLSSIFDYLFSQIENQQHKVKGVSAYESENLTYNLIERISKKYPELSHIKALCNYPLRYVIRDFAGLTEEEIKYASHPSTHIDFLIINRVTKEPLLSIETDGYSYHNEKTEQYRRDRMKDNILEKYGLPLLRLSTVGYGEEDRIVEALTHRLFNK